MYKTSLVTFKDLRTAYIEVKRFIEEETGAEIVSLHTKIEGDLGCAGDDNYDLIDKFVSKYKLDHSDFEYSKHFLSEGELFNSKTAFLTIISLPLVTIMWLIKIVTLKKVDPFKWEICFLSSERETLDLSFGDLLTWYLAGKYSLREQVRYILPSSL